MFIFDESTTHFGHSIILAQVAMESIYAIDIVVPALGLGLVFVLKMGMVSP